MQNYKTVEEKAAEWKLSVRYVQHLCRSGKVEGAEKHAEVWFIPVNTPSPAKYSRSHNSGFNFVGTKNKIFNSAIELFMLNGYDSVSIRDIANKAGIRQSTIYHYFNSKQEILDVIYDFYCHYFLKNRTSLKDMEAKLKNENAMDIIRHVRYEFSENYQQQMLNITKIIFQRISVDNRAREIAKTLIVDEGAKYNEDVFNMGIENGRFAAFDTHTVAVLINSVAVFTLLYWIIDPSSDDMAKLLADEKAIHKYVAGQIKDLKTQDVNHIERL